MLDNPGQAIQLASASGITASVFPYGARLGAVWVPTRGERINVVLGYGSADAYRGDPGYLGAAIGRLGGRVAGARFEQDGTPYALDANEGRNQLHGGVHGLHAKTWRILERRDGPEPLLVLGTESADGEGGYPGALRVEAHFILQGMTLVVELRATTDRPCPVALTYHPYFNLGGVSSGTVDGHTLQVEADAVLALDRECIPTGERLAVAGTPFDFRQMAGIGPCLAAEHPQLRIGGGLDHTWLLRQERSFDARLHHPGSGVSLIVRSAQPGLQVYDGHHLAPSRGWHARQGLCLEPQNLPDAVNHADFPSPWLQPGHRYVNRICYEFGSDTA